MAAVVTEVAATVVVTAAAMEVITAAAMEVVVIMEVATAEIGGATVMVHTGTVAAGGAAMASAPAGDPLLPDGFGSATNDKVLASVSSARVSSGRSTPSSRRRKGG